MADPRFEELAQQIDDDPDDHEAYRAYGDLLEEGGDPRSQLMAMQLLRDRLTDRGKLEHLTVRLEAFFEQHRDHFLGRLTKVVPKLTASRKVRDAAVQRFTWKYGFIHSACIRRQPSQKPAIDEILAALLTHPSGRFLIELAIDYPQDPIAFVDVLVKHAPRSLRKLVIGSNEVDLGRIWPVVPKLSSLAVISCGGLGEIDLPALREARFKSMRLPHAMTAIANARLPLLETLEIEHYGDELDDELRAILARDDLPNLRTLAIGTGHINQILPFFVQQPLAKQITTLDLGESYMLDDTGAAALQPLALDEIRLHVRAYHLSPRGRALLGKVAKSVVDVEPARLP